MRMVIVVPPHTTTFWLKVAARTISSKHPDVVVLGPADTHLQVQLIKYRVPIIEPPSVEPKPTKWWPRIRHWWGHRGDQAWDPWVESDVVMVLWDYSEFASKGVRKAKLMGKKIWYIRMGDRRTPVELPMRKP